MREYSTFGRHVTADMWGLKFDLLENEVFMEDIMTEAAKLSGATVVGYTKKKFQPFGLTAFVVLSESHLSVHTYPERGFAAFDCYTCGTPDPEIAINHLIEKLSPIHVQKMIIKRGTMDSGQTVIN